MHIVLISRFIYDGAFANLTLGTIMLARTVLLTTIGLLLMSCTSNQDEAEMTRDIIAEASDREWLLSEWDEDDFDPDTMNISLNIDSDNQSISGFAGCNNYQSEYTILDEPQGNLLVYSLTEVATTRMYCGDPSTLMNIESQYLGQISSAPFIVELADDQLIWTNTETDQTFTYSSATSGDDRP